MLIALLVIAILTLIGVLNMSAALARLQSDLQANTDASTAVLNLISTLAEQIRANVDDSDELNALADALENNSGKLAQAVTANTPAANPSPAPADTQPISSADGGDTGATPPASAPTSDVPLDSPPPPMFGSDTPAA